MLLTNESLSNKSLIFTKNNTSYQTDISLIRNNLTLNNQEDHLELNNISLSVAGMTDSGLKWITYSFNPQYINLNENNKANSLLKLDMVNDDDVVRSENNTLMIIANTFKNNLTTSILQPLPISIIKSEDSSTGSSSFPSSTLETNANYNNFNTLENSNTSSEVNLIDIIKYLSLAIAVILIGFIIYKRIKNRNVIKKK